MFPERRRVDPTGQDARMIAPDQTAAATPEAIAAVARAALPRCGSVRVVCIDGPAASGKTTLAELLASMLDCPVVHLDDLYQGWQQDLGALGPRLAAWLLDPWEVGLPGRYLRFDWALGRYREWVEVPAGPLVILEGCGAAGRHIRPRAALVVWVEAPGDERLARGISRDGVGLADHWRSWQSAEDAHFAADQTRAAADVVVRT